MAIPHRDSAADAQQIFSSDCIKISQEYWRISRNFGARWRKKIKQIKWRHKKWSRRRTLIGWRNLCRAVVLSRRRASAPNIVLETHLLPILYWVTKKNMGPAACRRSLCGVALTPDLRVVTAEIFGAFSRLVIIILIPAEWLQPL